MVFSALIANNKERRNNQKMAHVDMIDKEIIVPFQKILICQN